MTEIINVEKQMFLSNEITRVYYSSNMLTNFQDFSLDYVKNYNLVKDFLYNESKRASIAFDNFENSYSFLSLVGDQTIEEFAIKIINTYYSSGRLGDFNEFASEYINNYGLSCRVLKNNKGETSENSKLFR